MEHCNNSFFITSLSYCGVRRGSQATTVYAPSARVAKLVPTKCHEHNGMQISPPDSSPLPACMALGAGSMSRLPSGCRCLLVLPLVSLPAHARMCTPGGWGISLRITVGGRAAVYADSDRRPSMFVSAQPQQHRLELPSRCTGH